MNTGPLAGDWLRMIVVIGSEIVVLAAGLAVLSRFGSSAAWRRMQWRAGILGAVIIALCELAGVGRFLAGHLVRPQDESRTLRTTVVAGNLAPTVAPVPPAREPDPELVDALPPARAVQLQPIWWPAGLWFLGVAALLLRLVGARAIFALALQRRRHACASSTEVRANELRQLLGLRRSIRLLAMDGLVTPVSFGVLRPTIALPNGFGQDNDGARQDAMLAHELSHVRARDALWHVLADVIAAVFWWHPAVWWMRQQMLMASEMAADEASILVENGPQILAECLVATARRLVSPAGEGWQGMLGGRFQSGLGRRVERLLGLESSALRNVPSCQRWLGCLAATLLLAGIAFLGSWMAPPSGGSERLSWSQAWNASIGRLLWAQVLAADVDPRNNAPAGTTLDWQRWSREAVEAARVAGHPVLVFFTADWCVTGRVEERTALEAPMVRERLRELGVVALKADATLATNPAIDAELKTMNRGGVPMTLVYPAKQDLPPELLPEPLTARLVIASLDRAHGLAAIPTNSQAASIIPVRGAHSNIVNHATFSPDGRFLLTTNGDTLRVWDAATGRPATAPPGSNSVADDAVVITAVPTPRIEEINARLDSVLVNLPVTHGWLQTVLAELKTELRRADRTGPRIDFLLSAEKTRSPWSFSSPNGSWAEGDSLSLPDLPIEFAAPLINVTAREALNEIVRGAALPIRYALQTGGSIAVTWNFPPSESLQTRAFRIDPRRIGPALSQRLGREAALTPGTNSTFHEAIDYNLRGYLKKRGIEFPTPTPPERGGRQGNTGREMVWGQSRLLIRATREELDTIERELQSLNTLPPQVLLETHFCEVSRKTLSALGFDWMLGRIEATANSTTNGVVSGILTDPQKRVVLKALSQRKDVNLLNLLKITTLSGRQAQMKRVEVRPVVVPPATGKTYSGVTIVTPTNSSSQPLEVRQVETGLVLDVIPHVRDDGMSIDMTVIATVKEFVGYDLDAARQQFALPPDPPNDPVQSLPPLIGPEVSRERRGLRSAAATPTAASPTPIFRQRQMVTSSRLWDGQTLVLSGGEDQLRVVVGSEEKATPILGDLPLVGRLFRPEKGKRSAKVLIVFVTARIIDEAGNLVHREVEEPTAGPPSIPRR